MPGKWWGFDHFIFEEYKTSAASLGICRIVFAAYILLIILPQQAWVANFPDSFFNPPLGLTLFFTRFPGPLYFSIMNGLAILAAVFLLFGCRTRIASNGLALSLLLGNYWAYSFGTINHDIFLIVVPVVMQLAGWGSTCSVDARRRSLRGEAPEETKAWPVAFMALLVALAMLTAAVPKAMTGWLNPHLHAIRAHMLYNAIVTGRPNWIGAEVLRTHSPIFWKLLDYSTVLLEASFLFVVLNRRAFTVVCSLACFFHLGIALTMEIAFVSNLMAYGACVDWSPVVPHAGSFMRLWNWWIERTQVWMLAVVGVATSFVYLHFGNPLQISLEWDPIGVAICAAFAIMAALFLFSLWRDWFRLPRDSVILFDGYCGLCNGWVDFVLRHDRMAAYKFAALQSRAGQDVLNRFGLPGEFVDSIVLVEDGKAYLQSSAVLRCLRGLGFPYSLASTAVAIPQFVRNAVYQLVAKHRYGWFGKRDTCRLPSLEERQRFL